MEHADLILTGASVWRGDPARTWADAIAVRGDRILRVGTEAEVLEYAGARTERRHLPGRMVVPGFQDAHVHPPFGGRNLLHVNLNECVTREEYLAVIREYADAHPDAEWVIGGGWSMDLFPGGLPRREDLDAIVPDRPVFLFNRDVHGAWVNSRTLEVAGISAATPDPADGRIERDPDGTPSGMLHEGAAYTLNDTLVPKATVEEWQRAILQAQAHLHSLGITAWQDAWVTPDTQAAYRALGESGQLTARVVGALWWERSRGLEQIDELVARRSQGAPGFHPTTVKIMTDGVLENFSGALLEPYCDGCGGHTDNSGLAFVDPVVLAEATTALDALGFQVHFHTIGDRAVRIALDAIEAARAANGPSGNRHHLAHIQVVQPSDVPRFRALGAAANCQAYWAQNEAQMVEHTLPFLGPERAAMQYPFGALARHGTVMAMGSDWAVSTANPLDQIEVAVNRVGPLSRSNAPLLPEQSLTLAEALAAFTSGSAWVNHDEAHSGTLSDGMRADLAVLSHDLFAADAPPIADARVELTVASGQVVFEA